MGAWLGGDGFKIGINWGLGTAPTGWAAPDIPLAAFAPLAEIAGVRLISLQKGRRRSRSAASPSAAKSSAHIDPNPEIGNFVDAAALMMNLDLGVKPRHFIGSSCRRARAAGVHRVPQVPDWRWLQDAMTLRGIRPCGCSGKPAAKAGMPCWRGSPRPSPS